MQGFQEETGLIGAPIKTKADQVQKAKGKQKAMEPGKETECKKEKENKRKKETQERRTKSYFFLNILPYFEGFKISVLVVFALYVQYKGIYR